MSDVWEHRHQLQHRSSADAGPADGFVEKVDAPDWMNFVDWVQFDEDNANRPPDERLPDSAAWPDYVDMPAFTTAEAAYDDSLAIDPDQDGLSNLREFQLNIHPRINDSDGDGIWDGAEAEYDFDATDRQSSPLSSVQTTMEALQNELDAYLALKADQTVTAEALIQAWDHLNLAISETETFVTTLAQNASGTSALAILDEALGDVDRARQAAGTTAPENRVFVIYQSKTVSNTWGSFMDGSGWWSDHFGTQSESYQGNGPRWASWFGGLRYTENLLDPPVSAVGADIDTAVPYGFSDHHVALSLNGSIEWNSLGLHHKRVALTADRPFSSAFSKTYLAVKRTYQWASNDPYTFEPLGLVSLVLEPGKMVSDHPIDVVPPPPQAGFHQAMLFQPIGFAGGLSLDLLSPEKWLMIPQGEYNQFLLRSGASDSLPLQMKVVPEGLNYMQPFPSISKLPDQLVTIGPGGALGDGEALVFGVGDQFIEVPLLRFSVKPRRTVKVTVHPVGRATLGQTWVPPADRVTESELKAHLDSIYGEQANVFFDVRVKPVEYANWDIATGADFENQENYPAAGNQWFDMDRGDESPEQTAVLNKAPQDPWANFDIYLIGGCKGMQAHVHFDGRYYGAIPYNGLAEPQERRAWIKANGQRAVGDRSLLDTIAHEIGHLFLGSGHAEDPTYPHFLQGTDPEVRLMVGGERYKATKTARTLVKSEWDGIHARLPQL